MNKHINFFKSQDDLYFNFDKDTKMIVITGMIGSGKSCTSYELADKYNYPLFSIDVLFDYEARGMNEFELKIVNGFLKKYPIYSNFRNNRFNTFDVCNKLFDYIDDYVNKKNIHVIIDSSYFYKTITIDKFYMQRIIVKRTSLFKSIFRSTKRDIKNTCQINISLLKKIYFIFKINLYVLLDIVDTFKNYIQINRFISILYEKVNK